MNTKGLHKTFAVLVLCAAALTVLLVAMRPNAPTDDDHPLHTITALPDVQPPNVQGPDVQSPANLVAQAVPQDPIAVQDAPPAPFVPIFYAEPLPQHIRELIQGSTFHENTPFGFDALTYLTVTHVGFCGNPIIGSIIVAAEIAQEVLDIFEEIFLADFPIYSIRLIDHFDACDYASMDANNSHGFNFRYVAGTNRISRHGFGMAIDINPIQNPFVRGDVVLPPAGAAYLDRTDVRPGMIVTGCPVYTAFTSRGWTWGGNWNSMLDFHHFERR